MSLTNKLFVDSHKVEYDPLTGKAEIAPQFALKKHLKNHFYHYNTIDSIAKMIKAIPKYQELRMHPELTNLTCNLVENFISKQLSKCLDKRTIAIEALQKAFENDQFSDDEVNVLITQIEFLHSNDHIKKLTTSQKVYRYFKKNLALSIF
jgi:hypothetical protein